MQSAYCLNTADLDSYCSEQRNAAVLAKSTTGFSCRLHKWIRNYSTQYWSERLHQRLSIIKRKKYSSGSNARPTLPHCRHRAKDSMKESRVSRVNFNTNSCTSLRWFHLDACSLILPCLLLARTPSKTNVLETGPRRENHERIWALVSSMDLCRCFYECLSKNSTEYEKELRIGGYSSPKEIEHLQDGLPHFEVIQTIPRSRV